MGWGNVSIFPLLIIQSGQPNTGLFVYSVPPPLGLGNPPVFAVVAPGVTSDPFGNPVNAVLNIGNFSAAHSGFDQNGIEYLSDASGTVKIVIDPARGMFFYSGTAALGNPPQLALALTGVTADTFGNTITSSKILVQGNVITESGGIFRTAATAPLVQLDGPHDALFIYDASANLVDSITPVATSDGLGHTVYAGIVNYSTAVNAITQLLNGFLNVGTPGQIAGTGGAAPGQVGLASAGNPGVVRMDSGLTATGDADAFVDVRSKNAQASISAVSQRNIQLAGPLALSSEGSAPAQLAVAELWSDGNGFANTMAASGTGDAVVYQVGQATFRNTANQTGVAGVVTGLSANLGTGLYRFSGVLSVNNPSAGTDTPEMGFSGTGGLTAANLRASIEWFDSAAPAAFHASGQVTALGSQVGSGSTIAAGASAYAKFDGIVNVSAAGTFNVIAGLVAGTSLTALAFSYVTYWPVN